MSRPAPTPPRLFATLLTLTLQRSTADEVVGDLHEEFVDVAAKAGFHRARAWYAAHTIRGSASA
jgi:hypothetical protein